jgi:hypothetical protein
VSGFLSLFCKVILRGLIFLDRHIDPVIAKGIAEGDLDPVTHLPLNSGSAFTRAASGGTNTHTNANKPLRDLPVSAKAPNKASSSSSVKSGGIKDFFGECLIRMFFFVSFPFSPDRFWCMNLSSFFL